MKISITDSSVINQFNFDPNSFSIFQSSCYVDNQEFTFARLVSNLRWPETHVVSSNTILGPGEDPRAFEMFGMPACYSVKFNEAQGRFTPQLYMGVDGEWTRLEIAMGDNLSAGKNWAPFTYNDEVYFVHEISPFRVVKLEGDVVYSVFAQELPTEIQPLDRYPVLRGGCNGLDIGNDRILGFGHDNYAHNGIIKHRPFAWCIDMKNQKVDIVNIDFGWDDSYNIIDPTAFILKDGHYTLMTCETKTAWNNPTQSGRNGLYTISIE